MESQRLHRSSQNLVRIMHIPKHIYIFLRLHKSAYKILKKLASNIFQLIMESCQIKMNFFYLSNLYLFRTTFVENVDTFWVKQLAGTVTVTEATASSSAAIHSNNFIIVTSVSLLALMFFTRMEWVQIAIYESYLHIQIYMNMLPFKEMKIICAVISNSQTILPTIINSLIIALAMGLLCLIHKLKMNISMQISASISILVVYSIQIILNFVTKNVPAQIF